MTAPSAPALGNSSPSQRLAGVSLSPTRGLAWLLRTAPTRAGLRREALVRDPRCRTGAASAGAGSVTREGGLM